MKTLQSVAIIALGILLAVLPIVVTIYILLLIPLWVYGALLAMALGLGLMLTVMYRDRHSPEYEALGQVSIITNT